MTQHEKKHESILLMFLRTIGGFLLGSIIVLVLYRPDIADYEERLKAQVKVTENALALAENAITQSNESLAAAKEANMFAKEIMEANAACRKELENSQNQKSIEPDD